MIFPGCCHPARPSVFVTLNALIRAAALAFIPQLITVRASAHTSGSWQLGYSVPPSLLPSFLLSPLPSPLIFHAAELPLSSKSLLLFPPHPHLVVSISPSQVVSFITLQYIPLHVHLSSLFLHFLCRPSISHLSPPFLPPGPAGVTEAAQRGSVLPAADAAAADQQRPAAEPGSCAAGKGVWMSFIILPRRDRKKKTWKTRDKSNS